MGRRVKMTVVGYLDRGPDELETACVSTYEELVRKLVGRVENQPDAAASLVRESARVEVNLELVPHSEFLVRETVDGFWVVWDAHFDRIATTTSHPARSFARVEDAIRERTYFEDLAQREDG